MKQALHVALMTIIITAGTLLISCSSKVADKNSRHHFVFNPNNSDIKLSSSDTAYLIDRYLSLHADRIDTLDWPFPENKKTMRIVIDVSGTMFSKAYNTYCNGKNISFFDYSLNEMMRTFQKEGLLKNTSDIRVQLFGAQVKGMSYSIGDYREISIPSKKLVLKEVYYAQDNNKIEIDVVGHINNDPFNLYDSVFSIIKHMSSPFAADKIPHVVVNKTLLLQDIIFNTDDLRMVPGQKCLYYLTDGYFEYANNAELIPSSKISLKTLRGQFTNLREKIPVDSSLQFVFYGMNCMEDLVYRDKLNGFYKWFLKDSINHLKIYNLK